MKTREGFVSNSSSSSFVIDKKNLTNLQIEMIKNHSTIAEEMKLEYADHSWNINENKDTISGGTIMDNFDIFEYFTKIGIDSKFVAKDENFSVWNI